MRRVAPIDLATSLENLKLERDAIVLYDALAEIEKDQTRADAFRRIAANERRHAGIWADKLTELGATVPAPDGPQATGPADHADRPPVRHALRRGPGPGARGRRGSGLRRAGGLARGRRDRRGRARARARSGTGCEVEQAPTVRRDGVAVARRATSAADVGRFEQWHRTSSRSGTLRAVIFGVSDGLVSNLSLVMGVAGAASANPQFILLAGIAGLLAGAFSMAAGEYISMQSQRELFERQIELERAEMEAMPEEEEAELAAAYRAKGFAPDEAAPIAHRIFQDPETALDMLVREELGLDPDELGSPWGAAAGSMVAVRDRRRRAGHPVPVRWRADDHGDQPRAEPRRAVRGRRRR